MHVTAFEGGPRGRERALTFLDTVAACPPSCPWRPSIWTAACVAIEGLDAELLSRCFAVDAGTLGAVYVLELVRRFVGAASTRDDADASAVGSVLASAAAARRCPPTALDTHFLAPFLRWERVLALRDAGTLRLTPVSARMLCTSVAERPLVVLRMSGIDALVTAAAAHMAEGHEPATVLRATFQLLALAGPGAFTSAALARLDAACAHAQLGPWEPGLVRFLRRRQRADLERAVRYPCPILDDVQFDADVAALVRAYERAMEAMLWGRAELLSAEAAEGMADAVAREASWRARAPLVRLRSALRALTDDCDDN